MKLHQLLCRVCCVLFAVGIEAAGAEPAETETPAETQPASTAQQPLSLVADQTVSFSLDEATWMAIDISPDGEQFVLEVLGDLYTLPRAGGQAQPLSVGLSFDSQPRFSPDGRRLAFISDRDGQDDLWVMDLVSEESQNVTRAKGDDFYAAPTWSPDGEHVVVAKSSWGLSTFELWAHHPDGGKGVQITKAKAKSDTPRSARHNALGATYDASGRYLYYAKKRGGFTYNLSFPQWQIARRDMRTNVEDILTSAQGSAFSPMLSPDGQQLIYATRFEQQTGLRVRNLRDGSDEWLIYPVQKDEQESRYTRGLMPGMAFSPDGQTLFTTRDGKLLGVDLKSRQARIIPFQIDVEKQVVERLNFPYRTGLKPVHARLMDDAVLSPDGRRIAFATFRRIYVHDIGSGETKAVSPPDMIAAAPTWSPNGRELAYVSWSDREGGHIYRQRARAGARAKRLTRHAGYYLHPAWSPDGTRIVALRGSSHERLAREFDGGPVVGSDVVWLPATGGETQLILPSRGLSKPHFGPEPDRVYLHLSAGLFPTGGNGGLVSVRYDGTDRRNLLSVKGPGIYFAEEEVPAEFMELSPDGRHALVIHANQVYVIKLLPEMSNQKLKLSASSLPMVRLTDVGAHVSHWSADGQQVTWGVGRQFYQRAISSLVFDEKVREKLAEASSEQNGADALLEQDPAVVVTQMDVYLPRHTPQGQTALQNATVITMAEAGVIERATVLMDGDRIVALGSADDIEIPQDAHVIDLEGRYVMPGLVDTHAHFRSHRDVPMSSNWSLLANLAYGVTTGMDVQPSTVDLIGAQDMVDAGLLLGPRAFSTGPGVFSNNRFSSAEHAYAVLKRYRDHYGVRNIKAYIAGSRKQRHWLLDAARRLKLMPTTEGALDMKLNLTHMLDGFSGNEHNLPVAHLYDDVVQLAARTGIAYTPTLLVNYGGPWAENYFYTHHNPHHDAKLRRFTPYYALASRTLRRSWAHEDEYVTQTIADSARRIVEAGGQVGVGAHGQLQGLGYHWELWSLASGGFSAEQALHAATLGGARMLGLAQDIGSLEVGKLADLLVLNRNPLEDVRHTVDLHWVIKGGEIYEADTLDRVWPDPQPLPEQWWWQIYPKSGS